jgi:dihydroorotate dehydrogenase
VATSCPEQHRLGVKTLDSSAVANRLAELLKSLEWYELLSNGVREEIEAIVPGGADAVYRLDDDAIADLVFEVVNVFRRRRLEPVLSLHELPHPRYPVGNPAPSTTEAPPVAMWDPPRGPEPGLGGWKVLGFDVGFPIGIPSCELTCNADWIEYYARKGFHILTYRTVRNTATAGSPYDWVFLADVDRPWNVEETPKEVRRAEHPVPRDWRTVSTATSFVAPCPASDIWEADMREARRRLDRLGGHHLLIASVTDAVPVELKTAATLAADFVEVARKAENAGAQAIECYLARATAKDTTGGLLPCERSTETSLAIVRAVRAALRPETRLLIKLSGDLPLEGMEEVVVPLARERLIDGVSGISPVRVERVTTGTDGRTLWDEKSPGVAGYALRDLSRTFVERLSGIRDRLGLRFEILAMGGVMTAEDVWTYMRLGASAVQMATAAVSHPGLAAEAFAQYRPTVQAAEEWDGVVLEVAPDRSTFWARLARTDADVPDEEAQFEMTEVRPDERDRIEPGAVLTWRIGLIAEGDELVRRSSVRLKEVRFLSEDDLLAGKKLAERVAQASGSGPDSPLG